MADRKDVEEMYDKLADKFENYFLDLNVEEKGESEDIAENEDGKIENKPQVEIFEKLKDDFFMMDISSDGQNVFLVGENVVKKFKIPQDEYKATKEI